MTSDTCSVIYLNHLPEALTALPHWVTWKYEERDGKKTKVPYSPHGGKAKSNDPTTWGPLSMAIELRTRENFDGVGFQLAPPYVGIDFDHVRDPSTGTINPDALSEIKTLNSYTEISPSGTGIHVIVKGAIPGKRCRKGDREMYDKLRYLTMTSNVLPDFPPTINNSQDALDTLYEKWFGKEITTPLEPGNGAEVTDEQVLARCEEMFGEKFGKLLSGDIAGYPSPSEADLALCTMIASHVRSKLQIDRLFRNSGLIRNKWDESRGTQTYGEITILTALENTMRKLSNAKAKTKNRDPEEPRKTLLYFEKDGKLFLSTITPGDTFKFVHKVDNVLVFDEAVTGTDGILIYPRGLDRHKNSGELVRIVCYPKSEKLEDNVIVPTTELYHKIESHLSSYIDVSETDREMFVYYILYTWFSQKCHTALYLRLLADTGKGKTRILQAISDLCFYPITVSGASSYSGIMRINERYHGTLKIDESDLSGGASNPLIKYLNLGFEKGQLYCLSDKNDPDKQDYFDPFGPKIIAMRQPFGDNATEARCLSFTPSETQRTDIPVELGKEYYASVEDLRASIALLTLHMWDQIDGENLLDCGNMALEPRMKQMIRPLSIVLQMFPDGRERFETYMNARQKEVKNTRAQSWDGQLFNYVAALATGDEIPSEHSEFWRYYQNGKTQAVTGAMVAEAFKSKANSVTRSLTGIGFIVESDKIFVGETRQKLSIKKYVVPDAQRWRELVQRYAPDDLVQSLQTCPEVLRGKKWVDMHKEGGCGSSILPSQPDLLCAGQSVDTVETVLKVSGIPGTDTVSTLSTISSEHAGS
jgi:hypothetical protein